MALKDKVSTALLSDVGRVRNNNEDALDEDQDIGLLVLADGMGGYNAGEIASGITIATVVDTARREWKNLKQGEIDQSSGYSVEALMLRHAVETAHTTIYHVSQSQPQCAGMGTTVVACLFHDDRLSIAYVGDSVTMDVGGATAAGLTPILVDPHDDAADLVTCMRIGRIADLFELV